MMSRYILMIFMGSIFAVSNVFAIDNIDELFGKKSPSKDSFKYSKCNSVRTTFTEKLTYDELCRYGTGCPSVKRKEKYTAYCTTEKLSQCFEEKGWRLGHELVGLSKEIEIGLMTQSRSIKNGVMSGESCAYYN